jgi:hypothetical protein
MVDKVKKISDCKNLKNLGISVMCTSKANYCLNFDELQLLKIMFLKIYIKDFEGILTIKGSPALIISKVKILRSNCKFFEISPDEHVNPITLDFEKCSDLKA